MLTYCTSIHAGDSWEQVTGNVLLQILKVKERVSPAAPFPVGLRVSARAAAEAVPHKAAAFRNLCDRTGCFIPTINGFPFSDFQAVRVKERAYLPDWRSRERAEYTLQLIRLLEHWLPGGVTGSISTLPIGFAPLMKKNDLPLIRGNLLQVLERLERCAAAGRTIILALEPEPSCLLETAADVVEFRDILRLPPRLHPFLGVCYNLCHTAVNFQEPQADFALLAKSGIPVPKVHVSSAVRIVDAHQEAARFFDEPRYLHQTSVRRAGTTFRYSDICNACSGAAPTAGEWRIHFHLPIFDDGNHLYGSTNHLIAEALRYAPPDALLEIETYTYDILPPKIVSELSVVDLITMEFDWLRSCR